MNQSTMEKAGNRIVWRSNGDVAMVRRDGRGEERNDAVSRDGAVPARETSASDATGVLGPNAEPRAVARRLVGSIVSPTPDTFLQDNYGAWVRSKPSGGQKAVTFALVELLEDADALT